jgi:hypothetical protein
LEVAVALDWQADSFGDMPSEKLRMLLLESQVALCAAFGGKHLFRVPSAVPVPLGLAVGYGSSFLTTLQFSSVFPLS